MTERIRVEMKGGVADVRLVRADKMNALDDAMFSALIETGEQLKREAGVRAVVLSGEGRAFCAGLDTSNFAGMAGGRRSGGLVDTPRTPGGANRAQQAVMVWREVPVPVIAAVHGVAFVGDANEDSEATICRIGQVRRLGRLPFLDPLNAETLAPVFAEAFAEGFAL